MGLKPAQKITFIVQDQHPTHIITCQINYIIAA